ncbi:MAG: signal transduction histidine kinase [Haloarculaceae archaeon]|jgi:signal transduction histidine kinase
MSSDPNGTNGLTASLVSLDSIPAPVFGYDVPDDEPVIVEINGPLALTFDPVTTGTTLRRWLQSAVNADESQVDEICSSLANGSEADIDLEVGSADVEGSETNSYRLQTFGGSGDESQVQQYVLVTELRSTPDGSAEIDRIASVISHDLRNPLDVANAHLQAARETGDDEHFDQVRQSHDRMAQIIQDVLTLARGRNVLSIKADVDIGAIATDAWATVDTKEASLVLGDGLSTIEADPDRLQRLFENLFRNSIEHAHPTADDGTTGMAEADGVGSDRPLRVQVGSTNRGFFVADSGTGIPDEDRARVFDPGYSSNETGSGTGLGLTIVEEIAEAHDWTVSITDGSRGGARFEFRPRSREPCNTYDSD